MHALIWLSSKASITLKDAVRSHSSNIGLREVKRQKVVGALQRKELLSEPTIIKHNAPVPKLYSHHSSSSIVIIFWQVGLVQFQVFFGDECDCEKRQQRCFGDECLKNTLRKDNKYMQPLQRKKLCIQFSCSKQLHKFKTNSAFGNIDVQNLDLHSLSNLESVIGGIFLQHDRSNQISQEKVFKNTYLEFPS